MLFYAALAAAIVAGIGGQLLLKSGASEADDLIAQFANGRTLLGLALYVGAAFLYIVALRRIPVSVAFPSVSVSYAVIAALGYLLWNEPMGWPQIAGIVLICAGVSLLYQQG